MIRNEVKKNVCIEGVNLTDVALVELELLTQDDNAWLDGLINDVADVGFFLLENKEDMSESQRPEVDSLTIKLSYVRHVLKSLRFVKVK